MRQTILWMSLIAFGLHLVWEYARCLPFFIHGTVKPTHFSMIRATADDVILTWIAYSAVSLFHKDAYWFNTCWCWTHWSLLMIVASALSLSIEWYALKINRWA